MVIEKTCTDEADKRLESDVRKPAPLSRNFIKTQRLTGKVKTVRIFISAENIEFPADEDIQLKSKEEPMDLKLFESMEAPELRKYIEFLLWHYRLVDAFWFIYVTEHFDQTTAERINERIWWQLAPCGAKDLKSTFDLQEKGIQGFVKALKYFPWAIITEYDIETSANEAVLSVPSCPPQAARRKRGLDEFYCRDMHRGFFEGFAKEIDDRI